MLDDDRQSLKDESCFANISSCRSQLRTKFAKEIIIISFI